jgi:hypothetical protein
MIAKGLPLWAVLREDPRAGIVEVVAAGVRPEHLEARMEEFRATTSPLKRKVCLARLVVDEILEEGEEAAVRA